MSNSYYNHSTYPTPNAPGSSAQLRAELDLVSAGFNKLPTLTGNGYKVAMINSAGTAIVASSDLQSLAITGSTIDSTPIGATTRAAGNFTTLSANGAANLGTSVTIGGGTINNTPIGGTTPASGAFTTASASSGFTGNLTGNVTGNVTGAVTGNVTGNLTGNVTANTGTSTFNNVTINGSLDMDAGSSATIINLSTPTNSGDAANKGYVDTQTATRLALAGGTMSGVIAMGSNRITGLADPSSPQDAATKAYADSVAQGLDPKASVRVATTADISLSGTQTIDGVAVIAGDRVLVKNQSTTSANGIYVVAAGSWSRSSDMDVWTEFPGAFFFVEEGTTNDNSGWVCTVAAGGTVGSTAVTFEQFSGAGQINAGAGMTKTGNTLDVGTASSSRIVVNANNIDLATTGVTADTYAGLTIDAYGRVTTATALTTLAAYGITNAYTKTEIDATVSGLLAKSGGTMSGAIAMGANKITGLADPTLAQDAATKAYTDSILGSATSAAASASAASTSATNAANSATAASGSASAAATSATNAAASYDAFDDRYLGSKTSDPTVDNDGNALLTGALYWNSSANVMKVYDGAAWTAAYLPASGYLQKSGDTMTGNLTVNAGTDSRYLLQVSGTTQAQFQATASAIRLASNNTIPLVLATDGVDRVTLDNVGNVTFGSVTASGVFKVQGVNAGDLVVFESLDTSASAAPDVVLYRNSASPAASDQLGVLIWRGKDSGAADQQYARIGAEIVSPTAGAEAGALWFETVNAGAAVERFRMGAAGQWGIGGANYGTSGQVMISGGASAAPSWATLGVAGGGTGATSLTANNVILGNGTSAVQVVAPGTSGNVLTSNGTTWVSAAAGAALTGATTAARTTLGLSAGTAITTGIDNTFLGNSAGSSNTTADGNSAVGYQALFSNTTGFRNTALGKQAGRANTTAFALTAIGFEAGKASTGNGNTFVGSLAGTAVTTATNCVLVGNEAGASTTLGGNTIGIGYRAAYATTGNNSIAIGTESLSGGSLSGADNVGIGAQIMAIGTTGTRNTLIGNRSGVYVSSGNYNSALGYEALVNTTTAANNVAVGYQALNGNTTAGNNTAVGYQAAYSNTTTGSGLVAIGYRALYSASAISDGTAVGYQAGYSGGGNDSTAIGYNALYSSTSGRNTAVGANALRFVTSSGADNVAVGASAGYSTTAAGGTFIGASAGALVSTGPNNTIIGNQAGYTGTNNLTTGGNNTLIGYNAAASAATVSNEITLGNSSIATLRCQVTTITSLSDARDKANVQDLPAGLKFVKALRPVEFDWNMRDGGKVGEHDTGFIAQDLKAAQTQTGVDIPGLVYDINPERLEAGYGKLIPVLVKAIQELAAEVESLKSQLKGN